ncbi:MAG: Gfo/Idh/MocA family oxidoreductase [Clostridia bacterium]|nr:Gfo/Idh/MocA family oxidoreductase [Clostridia bacterium]
MTAFPLPQRPMPAAKPGEFCFSAAGLAHGHIVGMTRGLLEAGATLASVWDEDPQKVAAFVRAFPQAHPARCLDELLGAPDVRLVASAAVPSERCALGLRVMAAGKDYFVDKAPVTTLEQLERARLAASKTGRKYMVYYSERLHSEAATFADLLIRSGEIGRVIHMDGFGPHRLGAASRPDWFFDKARYGGILCDIGSHQLEQFLYFTGSQDARVLSARACNLAHPEHPGLEDFGDCTVTAPNGATGYFRVDWFTPDGLSTWGDGRTFIVGTDGFVELRKYVDLASGRPGGNMVYWANRHGEFRFNAEGQVGCPFFSRLIRDCIERTENAMTQEHAFRAAQLCLEAQALADRAH